MKRALTLSPRRARIILALALALFGSVPAPAYVLGSVEYAGRLQHPRWHGTSPQVTFVMNDRSLDLLPNLDRAVAPALAVEAALKSWAAGSVKLFFGGMVKTTDAGEDGDNLLTFADTPGNRDTVGDNWAITPLIWSVRSGSLIRIHEADIVFNSRYRYGGTGAADQVDIQGMAAHEIGHALGIEHSGHLTSTMYMYGNYGSLSNRTLEADDRAAFHALYGGGVGPLSGAIEGTVVTTADAAVFGAYVVAVDWNGVAPAGALTDRRGQFTITALLPGSYDVYAEPLDGPMHPDHLVHPYFTEARHPLMTRFHTTFVGGNASPAAVRVEAGKTTTLDPIRVETQAPVPNIPDFWWSMDYEVWKHGPAPVQPGQAMYLLLIGPGLSTWSVGGFTVSGSGVSIDETRYDQGTLDGGAPYIVLTVWVGSSARPGPRNLIFTDRNRRVILTGAIQVGTP